MRCESLQLDKGEWHVCGGGVKFWLIACEKRGDRFARAPAIYISGTYIYMQCVLVSKCDERGGDEKGRESGDAACREPDLSLSEPRGFGPSSPVENRNSLA